MPGLHFHDLRHTGNHLAAQTGASTKDLMARMGHDDMRAALIYQRATSEADRPIADRLSALVDGAPGADDRTTTTTGCRCTGAGRLIARQWHAASTAGHDDGPASRISASDLGLCYGADDGNRTRVFSLGS